MAHSQTISDGPEQLPERWTFLRLEEDSDGEFVIYDKSNSSAWVQSDHAFDAADVR